MIAYSKQFRLLRDKLKSINLKSNFNGQCEKEMDETKFDRLFNEKCINWYLNVEMNKNSFDETIAEEYHEKVTLYGYTIV